MEKMANAIHEYVRERIPSKGKQPVGIIVGTVDSENKIRIGWSKTNWKAGDKFDKGFGKALALHRALGWDEQPSLPVQMTDQMKRFEKRCSKYFKQASNENGQDQVLDMIKQVSGMIEDAARLLRKSLETE
jgi:hypothetical protein